VGFHVEGEFFMRLSNRAKKRLMDKLNYCKAINLSMENTIKKFDRQVIKEYNSIIGLESKKLKSASFVTIPQRARVTRSNELGHYNKGDYYYSDLNCVFQRA